jgi:hypothetical protein
MIRHEIGGKTPFKCAYNTGAVSRKAVAAEIEGNRGTSMRLTPPTNLTFVISMLLAALAIVGQFVSMIQVNMPISMFWVAIVAYIVLWLGNLLRGF